MRNISHLGLFFARLTRILRDFNETRPSDIIVVNWGAHYHDTPDQESLFREDMKSVLDAVGNMSNEATMVWR